MKFNWGTGILLVLIVFLALAAGFMIFASRQSVNLVHRDYYEKGVDYSEEMKVKERSLAFFDALETSLAESGLEVKISDEIAGKMESGNLLLYRPSDSRKDLNVDLKARENTVTFQRENLSNGRYILKFTWLANSLKYEIERPVNIQ